jgi:hypothetical protein
MSSDAGQVMLDARIARLPQWAQELIARQAGRITHLEADVTLLHDLLTGKVRADNSDTFLVQAAPALADGSDAPDTPLGKGARIRFADFYEVHYGRSTVGGADVLHVETVGDLVIVPVSRDKVIIRRA